MEQELHQRMDLPPGFRFHPTDEELITHYLARKVADPRFSALAVDEADLNKSEPWDLPSLAKMGEKEWYFFCLKDRKYPTGLRTNRATEAGYWKATGKDKDIFRGKALVGSKKTLVFYTGRAPKGDKSGWVMHEYRLHGKLNGVPKAASAKNEWVLCRVFKKSLGGLVPVPAAAKKGAGEMTRMDDMVLGHLPPLMDMSGGAAVNPAAAAHVTCFSNAMEGQFFNQTTVPQATAAGGNITDHLSLASSSPFLASYAQYGQGVSLVQLLENNVYIGEQRQPAAWPCKQGGRERLSASQDTGLTSDVNPEISSSSGQQKFDEDQLWGY